jgi:hypothetical protein
MDREGDPDNEESEQGTCTSYEDSKEYENGEESEGGDFIGDAIDAEMEREAKYRADKLAAQEAERKVITDLKDKVNKLEEQLLATQKDVADMKAVFDYIRSSNKEMDAFISIVREKEKT